MQGGGWRGETLGSAFSTEFGLLEFAGLTCLVYIATYVVCVPRKSTRIATRTREQNSENQAVHIAIVLEASCVPSPDIACRLRQLRGSASNHELHHLLEYAIGRFSEYLRAWALYSAPTSVLVHTVELVARGIEENMGLTFAYMPLRTYTRLAEYGLQICRAAIGGQMSCK